MAAQIYIDLCFHVEDRLDDRRWLLEHVLRAAGERVGYLEMMAKLAALELGAEEAMGLINPAVPMTRATRAVLSRFKRARETAMLLSTVVPTLDVHDVAMALTMCLPDTVPANLPKAVMEILPEADWTALLQGQIFSGAGEETVEPTQGERPCPA